jgi:hypothetical protein
MKTTLWMIIALVTGIVGFLVGYSVSGFSGAKRATEVAGHAAPAQDAAAHKPDAGGYAGAGAPARKAEAGGYGGAAAPAPKPEAGGYGAVQPANQHVQKPADKPKAAGY